MTEAPPLDLSTDGRPPNDKADYLFELRKYRVACGRLQEEIDRARSCILPPAEGGLGLFARHGIPEPLSMWRAVAGSHLPCVLFLYQWPNVASRARAFENFYDDPEWRRERSRTNGGSEIVDRIDDLLLTGPAIQELPADAIYGFSFARAADGAFRPVASLAPLCGSRTDRLSIVAYSSVEEALNSNGNERGLPLLCERVEMKVSA